MERHISIAYTSLSFDQGNCSHLCPLECDANLFNIAKESDLDLEAEETCLWFNFGFLSNRFTEITQSVKTTRADGWSFGPVLGNKLYESL